MFSLTLGWIFFFSDRHGGWNSNPFGLVILKSRDLCIASHQLRVYNKEQESITKSRSSGAVILIHFLIIDLLYKLQKCVQHTLQILLALVLISEILHLIYKDMLAFFYHWRRASNNYLFTLDILTDDCKVLISVGK